MALFRKILIANRGEIAVRVVRACRDLGITSAAVYSDADRTCLHVLLADEAYRLGPAPATESYLSIERVIDAARKSGAEAVHPGYGFLAENPEFSQACTDAGLVFIGPTPASMRLMGSKTAARQTARSQELPLVPGSLGPVSTPQQAYAEAERIGYPLMIKAAAGGGGKGMRLVKQPDELAPSLELARNEARTAFGDDEVYLEKAIARPRHIEMQILADVHGNYVYLGERECSIQRRHQKIIEETPSGLDPERRQQMGEAAIRAARAAGYVNAGTVEFLVDQEGNFYFLEMNTRLQVEHPVTEAVTGIDLVEEQIRIAAGLPLSFRQEQIQPRGHAIECRIYAEDWENNFFPSPGAITRLETPAGPGIREDSGVYQGWVVPLDYDPLLSKLIAWGADRPQAIARMRRALAEYEICGLKHSLGFFRLVFADDEYIAGNIDTGYVERLLARRGHATAVACETDWINVAAIAGAYTQQNGTKPASNNERATRSVWNQAARLAGLRTLHNALDR